MLCSNGVFWNVDSVWGGYLEVQGTDAPSKTGTYACTQFMTILVDVGGLTICVIGAGISAVMLGLFLP